MTDKIVILAGGISSRMKTHAAAEEKIDLSLIKDADERHKSMIRLGGNHRPFLDYLLFNVQKAGLKTALIVIGEKDRIIVDYYSEVRETLFNSLHFKFVVQPVPEGRTKPAGTSDALCRALEAVPEWKDDTFLVCNSDNLYSVEAMLILMNSEYPNAMIDYDRDSLEFEPERISRFAITKKNEKEFLTDIIEKPSAALISSFKEQDGFIGVSMNIFKLKYDMIYDCLAETPFHPVRNEKELPLSIKMMIDKYPDSLFAYRMFEHVPDLTSKKDIIPVQEYLRKNHPELS